MGARCRHRRNVGRVTTSYALHPKMVGRGRLGAKKKDESIKFIVDKLKLYGYKVTCRG